EAGAGGCGGRDRGAHGRPGARSGAARRGRSAVTLAPARRLVVAAAVWTGGTVLAVVWPALWGPLGGAIAVLAALVVWDATTLRRAGRVAVERGLPHRAAAGRD